MCVIMLNCLTLGMYQPCQDQDDAVCQTTRCRVLGAFDHFIFAFFAVELCVKVMAMGFVGHGTFFADTWNRLDMFIVVAG